MFSWLTKANLAKAISNKSVQYAIGILTVIVLVHQAYDFVYEKGRHDERIELQAQHNKALADARKLYEKQQQEALEILTKDMQDEIERIRSKQKTEEQRNEVIAFIGETVKVPPGCTAFANNLVRVLRKVRDIANGDTGETKGTDK